MGVGWWMRTFDRRRWDAIFGGGARGAEQKILDALLEWKEGYFDGTDGLGPGPNRVEILASQEGQEAKALAFHLARNGFTYYGLDPVQSKQLDNFGRTVCAPGALGDDLDVKWYSPDLLSWGEVSELLDRLRHSASLRRLHRSPRYLPLLLTGRRFGTEAQPNEPGHGYYAIFSPAEAVELSQEVAAAISVPLPWRQPRWQPETTETYFLAPLAGVVKSGRWLHMSYS